MKMTRRIAAVAVAGVLALAGLTAVTLAVGDRGHNAWATPGMSKHHGGKHKHMCKRGPGHLAKKLSVMETKIGIRANQLDAWRDFTDALLATAKRPGRAIMKAAGDNPEPFALAEAFADNMIARAESAEKLKAAVAKLRTTLTPEQLDKVEAIEARLRAKFAKHHKHHSKGPKGAPPKAKPDTAPDSGDGGDGNDGH